MALAATNFKIITPIIGVADLSAVYTDGSLGAPWIGTSNTLPSVTVAENVGQIVQAMDTNANAATLGAGGFGEFIFLRVPKSTTVTAGLLYYFKGSGYDATVVPTSLSSTTTGGTALALAINAVSSNANSYQYTWFQCGGRSTVLKDAVTVNPDVPLYVSGAAAGRVKVIASTLRGILGGRSANATTVTSTTSTVAIYLNGRPVLAAGI